MIGINSQNLTLHTSCTYTREQTEEVACVTFDTAVKCQICSRGVINTNVLERPNQLTVRDSFAEAYRMCNKHWIYYFGRNSDYT